VADPWTDDLAALGEKTRSQLRPIAATRTSLRMEPKMSFFKRRRILATALAALALAIAAPVAYAIGTKIFISVDTDKPATEIEQDIQSQLQAAGMTADVHADKSDGHLKVMIKSLPWTGSNVEIDVKGAHGSDVVQRRLEVQIETPQRMDDAALARLQAVLDSKDVKAAVEAPDLDADKVEEIVTDALVNAGFRSVQVDVDGDSITVHVTAPPTP
jgi:hypothetical protein